MATCKYCGKNGLLLRLNGIGACPDCAKDDNINLQETWERYESWENKEPLFAYYRRVIVTNRSMSANGTHLMRLARMFLDHGLFDDARKILLDVTRRFPEQRPMGRHYQFEALRGMGAYLEEAVQQLAISYLYAAQADENNCWDRDAFLAELKTVQEKLGWSDADAEGVAKLLEDSVAIKCFIESPFIAKYALYTEALNKQKAEAPAAEAPAPVAEDPADEEGIEVEITGETVETAPGTAVVEVVNEPEILPAVEELEVEIYEEPAEEAPATAPEATEGVQPAPVEEAAAPAEEAPAPKKRGRKKKNADKAE